MLFFGHIAISLAIADATGSEPEAAVIGNLLPDVMDKTGSWVLKLMPSGRWLAHGLPFFALTCAASRAVLPRKRRQAFVLGYAGHLIADHWAGGRLPLLAPFKGGGRRPKPRLDAARAVVYLTPEVAGLAYLLWRGKRRGGMLGGRD